MDAVPMSPTGSLLTHVSLIFTYIGIQMAVRKMKCHWKAALCVQTTLVNKANYRPVSSVRGLGSGLVPMELQPKSNWIRSAPAMCSAALKRCNSKLLNPCQSACPSDSGF